MQLWRSDPITDMDQPKLREYKLDLTFLPRSDDLLIGQNRHQTEFSYQHKYKFSGTQVDGWCTQQGIQQFSFFGLLLKEEKHVSGSNLLICFFELNSFSSLSAPLREVFPKVI